MGNQYLEEEKRKVVQNSTIADTLSAQSQVSDQYVRKKYVDAQQMKRAKDKAYGDKKVTKDAYTGEEIHRDHGAAKRKYKGNASSHQGETDHTVSAKAAHSFAKNLPHITDADVKAAVNRQHNFKEISKKNNTSKGEKSNAEHAKGNKNLTTKAKAKMVAAGAKATVLVKGELLLKSTGRDSVDVAKNVASVKLAQFVQGEISLSDAVIDTACDTVKGEMNALAIRTSVNVAENALNATGDYIAKHVGEEGTKKIIGEAATKVFRFLGDNAFIDNFDNITFDEYGLVDTEFDECQFDEDDFNDEPDGAAINATSTEPAIDYCPASDNSDLPNNISQCQSVNKSHSIYTPQKELQWTTKQVIEKSDVQTISNAKVYIGANTKLNGKLVFDRCEVFFEIGKDSGTICLYGTAVLIFKDCVIHCPEKDENSESTIVSEGNAKTTIEFSDCSIYGESSFIFTVGAVKMSGCTIMNAPKYFISRTSSFQVDNCKITYESNPQFDRFISSFGRVFYICENPAYVRNTTIEISKTEDNKKCSAYSPTDKAGIFEGAFGTTVKFENCRFVNVKKELFVRTTYSKQPYLLQDCVFVSCDKKVVKDIKCVNCTFEDSDSNLP